MMSGKKIQQFFKSLTVLFNIESFAFFYILAFGIFFAIVRKTKLDKDKYRAIFNRFFMVGLFYGTTCAAYTILKHVVNLPRPYCAELTSRVYTIINTDHERCLSTFPSAHTAFAMITAYGFWSFTKFFGKLIIILFVLLVVTSRIALAMHFPADTIYSALILIWVFKAAEFLYLFLDRDLVMENTDIGVVTAVGNFAYRELTGVDLTHTKSDN